MYEFRFDSRTGIFHVTTQGFWTMATLASFSVAALARGSAVRLKHGHFAILNDARDMPVQSNEVAKGIELLRNKAAMLTDGPCATVVSAMLNKMQAERVLKAGNNRVFLDWHQAEAWLTAEWGQRRAA